MGMRGYEGVCISQFVASLSAPVGRLKKFLKGGSLNGPAILLFNNSSCTFCVIKHGCSMADCKLFDVSGLSVPSKSRKAPCLKIDVMLSCFG